MQKKLTSKKLKELQRSLQIKKIQKISSLLKQNESNSDKSSETQSLDKSFELENDQQKKEILASDENQIVYIDDSQDQNSQNLTQNSDEDEKKQEKKSTKLQQLYESRPYVKGARRYLKNGQVYYRTATKFFQPEKHYFHRQQSSMLKQWIYGSGKTSDKILIASWNINGIRTALHKTTVCEYIKSVNADILCMVEVKINQWNYKRKPVKLPGYQGYWNFCKCSAGYSGIAVFSKFQPISAFQDFEERQFSQEGRVLTLQFEQFYLVVAYIPTAGQNLERLQYKVNLYERVFYKHCVKLLDKKHVIVAGDLNVCHTNLDMHVPKIIRKHQGKHPSSTKKQKTNFQMLLNMGFVDTFRRLNPNKKKYSWYNIKRLGRQKNLGKRLDYFLVDEGMIKGVTRSEVLSEIEGSDHCPIQLNLDLSLLQKQDEQRRQKGRKVREQYLLNYLMPKIKEEQEVLAEQILKSSLPKVQLESVRKRVEKEEKQKQKQKQKEMEKSELKQEDV